MVIMDTISNFIVKLKNAGDARHESVTVPHSSLKASISKVLKQEGFIRDAEEKMEKGKKVLAITLFKAENKIPKIKGVQRLSKPSKRIYKKATEIRGVKSGYGALVLTTSKGVMTGREAKKMKLGGEVLFTIW